jgi:hypothetical protein
MNSDPYSGFNLPVAILQAARDAEARLEGMLEDKGATYERDVALWELRRAVVPMLRTLSREGATDSWAVTYATGRIQKELELVWNNVEARAEAADRFAAGHLAAARKAVVTRG